MRTGFYPASLCVSQGYNVHRPAGSIPSHELRPVAGCKSCCATCAACCRNAHPTASFKQSVLPMLLSDFSDGDVIVIIAVEILNLDLVKRIGIGFASTLTGSSEPGNDKSLSVRSYNALLSATYVSAVTLNCCHKVTIFRRPCETPRRLVCSSKARDITLRRLFRVGRLRKMTARHIVSVGIATASAGNGSCSVGPSAVSDNIARVCVRECCPAQFPEIMPVNQRFVSSYSGAAQVVPE